MINISRVNVAESLPPTRREADLSIKDSKENLSTDTTSFHIGRSSAQLPPCPPVPPQLYRTCHEYEFYLLSFDTTIKLDKWQVLILMAEFSMTYFSRRDATGQ